MTYAPECAFSENIRRIKSPSSFDLKVEGIIAYSPGSNEKRPVTSREFTKLWERACDLWYKK